MLARTTFLVLTDEFSFWTTDKDGPIVELPAAEFTARTDDDANQFSASATKEFGKSHYKQLDGLFLQRLALGRPPPRIRRQKCLE